MQSAAAAGSGADWFGPQAPLRADRAPGGGGAAVRLSARLQPPTQPRAYEPIGFFELRALADSYDLLRCVIETRKDQMARLDWRIRPRRASGDDAAGDPAHRRRSNRSSRRPDGHHALGAWLRELLEDLFVIDAPTL